MEKTTESVTRGSGLLESWLSDKRSNKANQLIPESLRMGRILDIGCGTHPNFLSSIQFKEKFSLDQIPMSESKAKQLQITHFTHNLCKDPRLPFEDLFFSVVSLLAVIEHMDQQTGIAIMREINRILIPGGRIILTTPSAWTEGLLRFLAAIGFVSKQEIDEHISSYKLSTLKSSLQDAGFKSSQIQCGSFELGVNLWATAEK